MEKTNKKIKGLNPNRKIKRLAVFCLAVVGHNRRTLDRVFRYRKARRGHHEPGYAGESKSSDDHDAEGRGA